MPTKSAKPTIKIACIERKYWRKDFLAFSLERVFLQIANLLDKDRFSVSLVKVPFGNSMLDVVRNLILFRRPKADIYHITGQIHYMAMVLPANRTVLTIHDLAFLQGNGSNLKKRIIKKLFLDWPLRRLQFITTVSDATKQEIIQNSKCGPEKIRVIENPIQEHYLGGEPREFNTDCPLILQVGITDNKNIPRLLDALSGINCRVKIVGNMTKELQSLLATSNINCEVVLGLSDEEMRDAYRTADILAFCSTYEGFGLPIIEAQSMGTPVVTSNLRPMNEVSGGAAALVDPFDVESIRQGIIRVIEDEDFRLKIVSDGLENAKRFAPEKIAKRYQDLYEEMVEAI